MSVMPGTPSNILLWHVHGSWTTSLVHGPHRYLLPTLPEGGPLGRGRCGRPWPDSAVDVPATGLARHDIDVVILQRPEEEALVEQWTGRRPGTDIPAIYVEHNTPRGDAVQTRHPMADRTDVTLVHVTDFNRLMWDNGRCPTRVIHHGIVDPGHRFTGELPRAAALINEPVRRGRITGTDLLTPLSQDAPIDVFGIGTDGLERHVEGNVTGCGDLRTEQLYDEVARRRVYVHTARWTSLGLSLIEAMHLGIPVVAVAATEAAAAVPPAAGVVSADPQTLGLAIRRFVHEPELAAICGKSARDTAVAKYGLDRFLGDWNVLLAEAREKESP
jgi:hypothetical protein